MKVESALDELEGLLNRRTFDRDLAIVLSGSNLENTWLCIADLDEFGSFFEAFGAESADAAERSVGRILLQRFPGAVYRYSAEEWALLIRADSDVDGAELLAPVCHAVADLNISHAPSSGRERLSICIGAARLSAQESAQDAIRRADACFFKAKEAGGDGFVVDDGVDSLG